MLTAQQKKCVHIIAHGLKHRIPQDQIIQELVPFGLSSEDALKVFDLIQNGIKAGTSAAITNSISAQQYKRGESELFDAAFDEGFRAFKNQVQWIWLKRLMVIAVITVAVILFVKWLKKLW